MPKPPPKNVDEARVSWKHIKEQLPPSLDREWTTDGGGTAIDKNTTRFEGG